MDWRSLLFKTVTVVAGLYVLLVLWLWLRQTRLIFFPTRTVESTPAEVGLDYQEVWLPVEDTDDQIHGWWIPAAASQGAILYFHGNGYNVGAYVKRAGILQQLGFSVLLIDYRGYGLSQGNFASETQVYQDASTAWDYLVNQRQISPEKLFLYGFSLGGAVAIDLALRRDCGGVITESTFTSMQAMSDYQRSYRLFPIRLILHQRFDNLSKVSQLQTPILFIHGDSDVTVPPQMSKILYEAANAPKQLLIIPDADHLNVVSVGGEIYFKTVKQFLNLAVNSQP